MKELITALIKARQEFQPIRKDKANIFLKTKYATLDSVIEATESALSKHGLTIVQTTDLHEIGEGSMPIQILRTVLYHESGQMLTSVYQLPVTDDQQKMGAAITYGRRYAICAILNVTADSDDDGSANSKSTIATQPKQQANSKPVSKATQDDSSTESSSLKELMQLTDEQLARLGWTNVKGREHLESTYGKRSRQMLTDEELQDFLSFLKLQPVESQAVAS